MTHKKGKRNFFFTVYFALLMCRGKFKAVGSQPLNRSCLCVYRAAHVILQISCASERISRFSREICARSRKMPEV